MSPIPDDAPAAPASDDSIARRHPLAGPAGLALLKRLNEHPDAPAWNHAAGDLLQAPDLQQVEVFRAGLAARAPTSAPSAALIERLTRMQPRVPLWRERLAEQFDFAADWETIPFTSREDIASRPEKLVPDDADLGRMLVYRTAGTTGHALLVPHDRVAIACYNPLIELALRRYGLEPGFSPESVACFNVGAQAATVTYPSLLSALGGGGFAKLNINPRLWPRGDSAQRYFAEFAPAFLTGDPLSFAEMLRLGIEARPLAMLTTAVALSAGLRRRLEAAYGCPVIDWYSLTETGPLAYGCRLGHGYHLLSPDVHVEVIAADGQLAADGEVGEVVVSGGRNPYLPMLRYRTGDWGRLDSSACACGDPMPRLIDLEGRAPVVLRAADGTPVNPVDVSRALRELPLVAHELVQHADRSLRFRYRIAGPLPPARVEDCLRQIFGGLELDLAEDIGLGMRELAGKVMPYRSELLDD